MSQLPACAADGRPRITHAHRCFAQPGCAVKALARQGSSVGVPHRPQPPLPSSTGRIAGDPHARAGADLTTAHGRTQPARGLAACQATRRFRVTQWGSPTVAWRPGRAATLWARRQTPRFTGMPDRTFWPACPVNVRSTASRRIGPDRPKF